MSGSPNPEAIATPSKVATLPTAHPDSTVSLDEARRADPRVRAPDALALEEERNSHARATLLAEQGWIGHLLGSKSEKPGNVAAIVIFFCFVLLIIGFCVLSHHNGKTSNEDFFKFTSIITGIIGIALGYLFGSSTNKS